MQAEDNAARAATDCERARERICRDIPTCKSDFVTRSGLLHAVVMVPSMYGEVEDEAKDGWGRRRDDERLQQLLDDDRICVELRFSFAVSTTVDSGEWMPACAR